MPGKHELTGHFLKCSASGEKFVSVIVAYICNYAAQCFYITGVQDGLYKLTQTGAKYAAEVFMADEGGK